MEATPGHSATAAVRRGADTGMMLSDRPEERGWRVGRPASTRGGALLARSISEALAASAREARP
jgi:hypothetical protein